MHPTLFTIGKFAIPTYTVLLDLGLILGLVITYFEGKRQLKNGTLALDLGLWVVIGGIVGGRIGYVLANWHVFSEDWTRVFRIWEGGLSFHGAFLGGLLVMFLFALLRRRDEQPVSFWQLADVLTLGLALGVVFGWAACLLGGCAYGVLGEGSGYAVLPDIYGVEASRFATQAVGVAYSLVLFVGFFLLRGRWPFAGASFLMYSLLYFTGQFFLEFTRADEAIYLGPWRLAQWLNLALALAAAAGLIVLWWRANKRSKTQEHAEYPTPQEDQETSEDAAIGESAPAQEIGVPTGAEESEAKKEPEETQGTDVSQP